MALVAGVGMTVPGSTGRAAGPSSLAVPTTESSWNGAWAISRTRNAKAIRAAAAVGYRFHLTPDGRIRWEIPTLDEVVEGRVDGRPMPVRRPGVRNQTLAVTAEGPYVLRYVVTFDGIPRGEGRMTLIEHGKAWVDISQPFGHPELAHVVIYVRPPATDE